MLPQDTSIQRTPPSQGTLILLTAVSVLTLNLFLPSLPSMAKDFRVSYGTISLAIAGYLMLSAILTLVLGPIADRYGRRPVLLISFGLFAAASIGAALSQSFFWFIVFRMIQAVCATGSTLSRAIVRDMLPPGPAASMLGYIAMAMAIVPMLGPLVGGLLEESFGWRSVFWLFAVVGSLCFALIWVDLGETMPSKGVTVEQQVSGYIELLKSGVFWGYTMVISLSVGGFFVFLAGAPFVASEVYGLAPSNVGITIGSTAAGFFFGSMISGRLAASVSLVKMMIWGRVVASLGPAIALGLAVAGLSGPWSVFACLVSLGLGNGISLPSSNMGAMSVRAELAGSASGLSAALATATGALLSAGAGAVLSPENAEVVFLGALLAVCLGSLLFACQTGRLVASGAGRDA